jgi:phosphatidylinositol 3-kinase
MEENRHEWREDEEWEVQSHAVDLSFSQILEAQAWQNQRRNKRLPTNLSGGRNGRTNSSIKNNSMGMHQNNGFTRMVDPSATLVSVSEEYEEYETNENIHAGGAQSNSSSSSSLSGQDNHDEWLMGDTYKQDVYRFVQPRRLSSWVQDDAVNACFKCHTFFTLLNRKHHCRYLFFFFFFSS